MTGGGEEDGEKERAVDAGPVKDVGQEEEGGEV